jgi:hypothetical protein
LQASRIRLQENCHDSGQNIPANDLCGVGVRLCHHYQLRGSGATAGQCAAAAARPRLQPGFEGEHDTSAVTGCVKPGTEPKTYLLLETLSLLTPEGAAPKPVTIREGGSRYQLFTDGTIDLSKLVGREVHANGTISKPAVSSDEHKATTVVDAIPKMTVKTLRETGSAC